MLSRAAGLTLQVGGSQEAESLAACTADVSETGQHHHLRHDYIICTQPARASSVCKPCCLISDTNAGEPPAMQFCAALWPQNLWYWGKLGHTLAEVTATVSREACRQEADLLGRPAEARSHCSTLL